MYLLDTDTCSFVLKRRFGVAERMQRLSADDVAVSSVTLAEAWTGAAKSQDPVETRRIWDHFFKPLRILDFDDKAADRYATVRAHLERKGTMIGGNDCMIAAVALAHELIVVTGNAEEFERVPRLKVENWAGS
jgi:tRNA(fMet)-specific endonuclease VapC